MVGSRVVWLSRNSQRLEAVCWIFFLQLFAKTEDKLIVSTEIRVSSNGWILAP